MTQSLTSTQQILYGPHSASGRVVIKNDTDQQNRTAVALGGWEMMRAIGLSVKNLLLKEAELGAFIAMTTSKDVGYSKMYVANTSLGAALNERIIDELKILNDFNIAYNYQARVFGADISFTNRAASSNDETRTIFQQDTGVTWKYLKELLDNGCAIFPDRNDARLAELLSDARLMQTTQQLNDKNHFYRFLRKRSVTFPYPEGVLIDEIPHDILLDLEALNGEEALAQFEHSMLNAKIQYEGIFDPSINYFVKVSGGAGGNAVEPSMCRFHMHGDQAEEFKGVIANLIRRSHQQHESRGLQLSVPIEARKSNTSNPLDPQNTRPFSPCLTYRIGPNGTFGIGQVAEQVLMNGLSCIGSYWNQAWHDEFIVRHALSIDQLGQELSLEGFRGYFGTDFIQNNHDVYEMTVDGNARMNVNDMLYFVRKPLEIQGVKVKDIFMGSLKFEAGDDAYAEALRELCGQFRYSHLRFGGLTLWPSFHQDTYLGLSKVRKATAIYVNPSYEPEKFEAFLKLVQ